MGESLMRQSFLRWWIFKQDGWIWILVSIWAISSLGIGIYGNTYDKSFLILGLVIVIVPPLFIFILFIIWLIYSDYKQLKEEFNKGD